MKLRIKLLRENAEMTQTMLAQKVGTTMQNISKYENGTTEPNLETLSRLAEVFGVTVDYLMGLSDNPHGALVKYKDATDGPDLDYVYMMGADGSRKRVYIPPEKAARFKMLIAAGFPELTEE